MRMDSLQKLREIHLQATKEALKKSVQQDTLIIQAQNSSETLQKVANTLAEKLKEWYVLYNPEFLHKIKDNQEFTQKIINKSRKELLQEIGKKEQETMGGTLQQKDIEAFTSLAKNINELFAQTKNLQNYIENSLQQVCPNTLALAGPQITAKLLVLTNGIKKLAEMPSSAIQLLGAEKALFRHLKQGAKTPKFGVLQGHPLVQTARKKIKGKIARALADKIAIAAKIDYFKGTFIGGKLRKQIEQKFT